MRKKLLALLSLVMVFALSLALSVSTVFAADENATDYAKDSTKWMWLNQLTVTEDGLKTTAASYNAASNPISANAKIKVVENANIPDGQWGYHSIMFKANDASVYAWNPGQTTSASNWLAVGMRSDTSSFAIYECKDGVVSVVAEKTGVSGYDNWYMFKQTNTWVIEYKDVEDGVEVTASFTATDGIGHTATGTTHTVSYKSTNTALHGTGSIAIGRHGGGTVSEENYSTINVYVEEIKNEPVEPSGSEFGSDTANWSSLTGVATSNNGLVTNATTSRAVTKAIGGNSTIDITLNSPSTTGAWQYEWVMLKSTSLDNAWVPVANASTATSSVGDWLGVSFGGSSGNFFFVESVDGVITMTPNYTISNYAHWYSDEQTTNLVITTTDTDEGVTLTVVFTSSDCANESGVEETYTVTYKSTNKKLWGEQKVLIGHAGANTNAITYNVQVEDKASEYVYTEPEVPAEPDFGSDAANWSSLTGVATSNNGLVTNATTSRAVTKTIGGNSTIDITLNSPSTTGTWQYEWVMLKSTSLDTAWVPVANATTATSSVGNWLGVSFGGASGNFFFVESVDGVITMTPNYTISNYAHWYSDEQITNLVITTTDTDEGVTLTVVFTSSECVNASAVEATYTVTYKSTNKKLWGEQNVLIGHFGDNTNSITYNVDVNDVASESSYDMFVAQGVKTLIAGLTTDVTTENYTDVNAAYVTANTAYLALTEAQKAFITAEEVKLLEDCKVALDVVARELALASLVSKIETLPTEITLANYADAKVAIEEAETLYASLTAEEQATITNANVLTAIGEALDVFETNMETAKTVIELIEELPSEVSRINYSADLANAINTVKANYEALAEDVKIHVSNFAKLNATVESLEAYEATLEEPEYDATNLAQNDDAWSRYGNVNATLVNIDNYGMALLGSTSLHKGMLLKNNVKENSTITVRFDALTNTTWGQSYVMFKNMEGASTVDAGAPIIAEDHGGVVGAPSGTWMALMFGNSSALYFTYCVDGVVTKIMVTDVPSSEYNEGHLQITEITIVTVDTQTGVDVTITYKASGAEGLVGETYTLNYSVENTVFHGDHAVAVGTYNGGGEGSKVLVTDFRVSHESGEAFVKRTDGNEFNFATDRKYWKAGANMAGFEFNENGASLWDVKTGGLLLNQKIEDKQTVYVNIDSTLTRNEASYGNVYFIIRQKEATLLFNGSHYPAEQGNYIVLAVGADGIRMFECVNGVMLHDAKLLSNGVVEGGYSYNNTVNGNDVWYIYDNYTAFEFYSEDVLGGVEVYITIKAPSGAVYHLEYFSENEALQGDSYFGIEYFLHANGTSKGIMCLESVRIDGVTEGFVPNVDVTALNTQISTLATTVITAENVESVKTEYAQILETVETLNYDMLNALDNNALAALSSNIVSYDREALVIEDLIYEIDELPAEVTLETLEEVKAEVERLKAIYSTLSASGKTAVTNYSNVTTLESAIEAIEIDLDAAAAFDAFVVAIPELTEDNRAEVESAIENAETAYEALTEAQKALTTKYEELVARRNALPELPAESGEGNTSGGCLGGIGTSSILALAALVAIKRLKKRA